MPNSRPTEFQVFGLIGPEGLIRQGHFHLTQFEWGGVVGAVLIKFMDAAQEWRETHGR